MKKRLPIGIDDYKEVIEGGYYHIDKTLLIKELYEEGGKITLLPRPRRFGKTLNISMLRYFFEKTAASHAHLFTDKQIWQHDTYRAMQGTFPVISITFKDVKHTTWQETYEALATVLAEEIKRHKSSLHGVMDEYDQERIDKLIRQTASSADYSSSLKFLSQLLSRAYNRNVIVLLDEYDTPIHTGFVHGFYDEVVSFVRNLMGGVFKG
ncbi:AAA family ATPase, partial [Candidatus Dependentiae bacterium]|nr:AAA family ATPase [Candidatus Dependentiae bacterium]